MKYHYMVTRLTILGELKIGEVMCNMQGVYYKILNYKKVKILSLSFLAA